MITAGIDVGSRTIKVVVLDGPSDILVSHTADQGTRQAELAESVFSQALASAGVKRSSLSRVVATGYGRNAAAFADTTITEITCHARGVRQLCPEARTVVDIGGQDSKLIRLEASGAVRDFAMNERCAAGTGRFFEVVAARLGAGLADLGAMARASRRPASINSTCVVFAETEIIGLLAAGVAPEDIVAGVQASIAQRVASMAGRRIEPPVVFTGGVAMLAGMAEALGAALGVEITVAPQPQITGALGAAILAGKE